MPSRRYWIRFGLLGQVGRFDEDHVDSPGRSFSQGDWLVVATPRGRELGQLLAETADRDGASLGRVLGVATDGDHRRAALARDQRPSLAAAIDAIFGVGLWPIDVVDAELTLDDRLVIHFLGPHGFATAGLAALLRDRLGREIRFQPIGPDVPLAEPDSVQSERCGEGGCGSCGSADDEAPAQAARGCGSGGSGGCAGCGVPALTKTRHGPKPVG